MDKVTLKALRGSIKKWELIVKGEKTDRGTANCPLCKVFIDSECMGCPVAEKTKEEGCRGTPYIEFMTAVDKDYADFVGDGLYPRTFYDEVRVIGPRSQQAAIDEYNFLVSLLP